MNSNSDSNTSNNDNIEREVKFLNIDVPAITSKLLELGAKDLGKHLLSEVIFYVGPDSNIERKSRQYLRIRKMGSKTFLTYKHLPDTPSIGVKEIEIEVSNPIQTQLMIEALGWQPARTQEKRRHSFTLGPATIDIDTWPRGVPPYLEIEAGNEQDIKNTAEQLGLDWSEHELKSAATILKHYYNIDIWQLKEFTFSSIL